MKMGADRWPIRLSGLQGGNGSLVSGDRVVWSTWNPNLLCDEIYTQKMGADRGSVQVARVKSRVYAPLHRVSGDRIVWWVYAPSSKPHLYLAVPR